MESKEKQKEIFLKISAFLTGFETVDLQGTGQVDTYFALVEEYANSDNLKFFLEEARSILEKGEVNRATINEAIKENLMPSSSYQGLAKNIITLWYTGNWNNDVVSPETYKQGLIWGIANAHPPGAKQPGFGSWANKPLSAKQVIT